MHLEIRCEIFRYIISLILLPAQFYKCFDGDIRNPSKTCVLFFGWGWLRIKWWGRKSQRVCWPPHNLNLFESIVPKWYPGNLLPLHPKHFNSIFHVSTLQSGMDISHTGYWWQLNFWGTEVESQCRLPMQKIRVMPFVWNIVEERINAHKGQQTQQLFGFFLPLIMILQPKVVCCLYTVPIKSHFIPLSVQFDLKLRPLTGIHYCRAEKFC